MTDMWRKVSHDERVYELNILKHEKLGQLLGMIDVVMLAEEFPTSSASPRSCSGCAKPARTTTSPAPPTSTRGWPRNDHHILARPSSATTLSQRSNSKWPTTSNPPDSTNITEFLRKESTGANFGNIDASDLKPPQLKLLAGQSPEVTDGVPGARSRQFLADDPQPQPRPKRRRLAHLAAQVLSGLGAESAGIGPEGTARGRVRRRQLGRPEPVVSRSGSPAIRGSTLGSLAAPSPRRARTSSARAQDDDKSSKPIATLTYDTLWFIDLPNGKNNCACSRPQEQELSQLRTSFRLYKAMGIDQFYQRYRIVVQRKTGPTGDPYFTFDYQYRGRGRDNGGGEDVS